MSAALEPWVTLNETVTKLCDDVGPAFTKVQKVKFIEPGSFGIMGIHLR